MFQKLQTTFKRAFGKTKKELRIAITEQDMTLFEDGREVWHFQWSDVMRIETYKRDLFSVDMICLDFFVEFRQLAFPTHDEMQGFDVLCDQLRRYFPSIEEEWWSQVAFPAFAGNNRVLYE